MAVKVKAKIQDVTSDAQIVDEIIDNLSDKSSQTVKEVAQGDIQALKVAAQIYLNTVTELQRHVDDFENLLKHQKAFRHNHADFATVPEYIQNQEQIHNFLNSEIPQKLYAASFDFQEALNSFLGQTISMIYVFENKEGEPELFEITSHDVLKYDYSSSNKLAARYKGDLNTLSTAMRQMQFTTRWNFDMLGLKTTYKEVMWRYDRSRDVKKRFVAWHYPGQEWHYMSVSAKGDINEAYANIVLLNRTDPSFKHSLEQNIGDFMEKVAEVDSASGLLQGDITNNNIEYGIKSADASTLSLKQIITVAHRVLEENFDQNTLKEIKEDFRKKGRTRNKIKTNLDATVTKYVRDAITAAHLQTT